MTALMGAVENQKQVSHRSHRPWKSLRDFHTPAVRLLLIDNEIQNRPKCHRILGSQRVSDQGCSPCLSPVFLSSPFLEAPVVQERCIGHYVAVFPVHYNDPIP